MDWPEWSHAGDCGIGAKPNTPGTAEQYFSSASVKGDDLSLARDDQMCLNTKPMTWQPRLTAPPGDPRDGTLERLICFGMVCDMIQGDFSELTSLDL